MYFAARVTYNLRMVSSTPITMYLVVHCLTLSSISLSLLVSGSIVTVWTAQLQVHLCLILTKTIHSLLSEFNTSNYPFIHPIIIMFFKPNTIKSSTVRNILLNPSTNQVMVQFKNNTKTYLYDNVDVEAITDVFFGEITSFGKFVNAYCKGNLTTVVG